MKKNSELDIEKQKSTVFLDSHTLTRLETFKGRLWRENAVNLFFPNRFSQITFFSPYKLI